MTSSQRHLTISKLIAGGKSTAAPKNASLIGQLTVIDKNQSEFPRGTLLFSDKTGSIQCQLCKPLKRHWLKRDICLISWNYIHELFLPNLEIISEPLIVIKEDTQLENIKSNIYLYRPMMEGRNFMCTDDEVYAQYSPLTVKQVSLLITNKEKLQDPINLEVSTSFLGGMSS
ncbi:hypothetical protein G9A89_005160 [Geosiphon pyriformis]|nr:hypothetical protein G9A89_005160 [Geosiphon pyriformis]